MAIGEVALRFVGLCILGKIIAISSRIAAKSAGLPSHRTQIMGIMDGSHLRGREFGRFGTDDLTKAVPGAETLFTWNAWHFTRRQVPLLFAKRTARAMQ